MSAIDRVKELLAAASPGPWKAAPNTSVGAVWVSAPSEGEIFEPESQPSTLGSFGRKARGIFLGRLRRIRYPLETNEEADARHWKRMRANAQLAALTPTLVLELVASQEALKKCADILNKEGWPDGLTYEETITALRLEKLEAVMER